MRRDDDRAVRVFLRDFEQRVDHARLYVVIGLGPGHVEMRGIIQEGVEELRLVPAYIGEGRSLPGTDIDLPQAPVALYGKSMKFRDGRSREAGAIEIAGIHGVHRNVLETQRQKIPLLTADRCYIPIPVALHVAIEIPLRLHMSNYINFCHNSAS